MIASTIREHVRVRIAADGARAHLIIDPTGDHVLPTREDLVDVLKDAGVVYGILPEGLDRALASGPSGEPILIAEGAAPVHGKDGRVELLVGSIDTLPDDEHSLRVNLRERHLIHNVMKGDRLAIVHPPEPGLPGYTVSGAVIPPREGQPRDVTLEPNTALSPDDRNVIIASEDGHAFLRENGGIQVTPVITVPGDVDYAVGNIDFVGSLIVMGDIKSDFIVKVKKLLEVHGNIEDAQIEVGGNVIVKKGFVGRGKGQILSGGCVAVQHVLNQTVNAAGDVLIEKESVNGNIRSGGKIISPHAMIAGGSLDAEKEIEVHTLGSADGSTAKVRSGRRGRILERLAGIEKEMKQKEKQLGEVKEAVFRLIRMKLDVGNLGPDKELMLSKLQEVQKVLPQQIEALHQEKLRLTGDLHKTSEARVIVRGTIHENVHLEINGVHKIVENALCGVIFYELSGIVEARAL